jgi:hypothetical protein
MGNLRENGENATGESAGVPGAETVYEHTE